MVKKILCDASGTIHDVQEAEFPVHENLTWHDCADDKVGIGWKRNRDGSVTDVQGEFLASPEGKAELTRIARYDGYGPIADQLDMMYWDQVNGTTTFRDHIAAVKAAHPKA